MDRIRATLRRRGPLVIVVLATCLSFACAPIDRDRAPPPVGAAGTISSTQIVWVPAEKRQEALALLGERAYIALDDLQLAHFVPGKRPRLAARYRPYLMAAQVTDISLASIRAWREHGTVHLHTDGPLGPCVAKPVILFLAAAPKRVEASGIVYP